MKVIIAGSRTIPQEVAVINGLNKSGFKPTEIVSGTAKGADQAGERYAKHKNIPIKQFPADWDNYGKSAGYKRNAEMAKYADALLAIWDGKSKGTKHMIDLMEKEGKPVYIYMVV